jgi:hypothetical protein
MIMLIDSEKSLWKKMTSLLDKSPKETRKRRVIAHHNKGYL